MIAAEKEAIGEALEACCLADGDGSSLAAVLVDVGVGVLGEMGRHRPGGLVGEQLAPLLVESIVAIRRNEPVLQRIVGARARHQQLPEGRPLAECLLKALPGTVRRA